MTLRSHKVLKHSSKAKFTHFQLISTVFFNGVSKKTDILLYNKTKIHHPDNVFLKVSLFWLFRDVTSIVFALDVTSY